MPHSSWHTFGKFIIVSAICCLVLYSIRETTGIIRDYNDISAPNVPFQGVSALGDAWTLCSDTPPAEAKLWPSVSNGHLGFQIHGNGVYVNGLYSGENVKSKRARIPAMTSISIDDSALPIISRSYCLDMAKGMYRESYKGQHFNFTMTVYVHRQITRLLVTQLSTSTDGNQPAMSVPVRVNHGPDSHEIDFTQGPDNGTRRYMHGYTKQAETPSSGKTPIHVYYTAPPTSINIQAGAKVNADQIILFAASVFQQEAKDAYEHGMDLFVVHSLDSGHVSEWRQTWRSGVDVLGNETLAAAVNSALYYIISSMPVKADDTWPFVGLSPAGLPSNGYNGHVFWDQDTWMYPPILILHAHLGKILVQTRTRMLNGSYVTAQRNGYHGAQYAWESALTGEDVTPWKPARVYEVHVTGDVALAFKQYISMTMDTSLILNGRIKEATFAIADFWVSRVKYNSTRDVYEILENMPPDEWHFPVNNSAYCNYVAKISLLMPRYVCKVLHCTMNPSYEYIANNMYIPFDDVNMYHPEYDGYTMNVTVKQGDVILLGYPLQMNMSRQVRYNDLNIYEKVTGDGPAMTWGMFSLGYLDVDEPQRAADMFFKQLGNKRRPFNVWTEQADGSGVTNFITGQGGFLQSVINGYGGVRIFEDYITIQCRPLPTTTGLKIRGLDYLGNSLDIECDNANTQLTLQSASRQLYLKPTLSHQVVKLQLHHRLEFPQQKLYLTAEPGTYTPGTEIVG